MARRSEYVHVAAANLECQEHVDPFQGERAVDVEEVHGLSSPAFFGPGFYWYYATSWLFNQAS